MSIRQATTTAPDGGSYRVTVVRCDAPECRAWAALHHAERDGWAVAPYADRCPDCRSAPRPANGEVDGRGAPNR